VSLRMVENNGKQEMQNARTKRHLQPVPKKGDSSGSMWEKTSKKEKKGGATKSRLEKGEVTRGGKWRRPYTGRKKGGRFREQRKGSVSKKKNH